MITHNPNNEGQAPMFETIGQMSANLQFSFPEPLTEKYRPRTFDGFVGLEKIRKCMTRLSESPFPSAWLFIGPSGTGKTTMALALAEAIPAELHHIPSQECNLENIERVRRTCQYVPQAGKRFHLVLVDEAGRMSVARYLNWNFIIGCCLLAVAWGVAWMWWRIL